MSESGKVAIVTGAGTGIGRASALGLVAAGWSVVITGRRQELLDAGVAEAGPGAPILAVQADIRDPASVEAVFDATLSRFGRLDLLFNNAGVGAPAVPLDELDIELWRAVIDTNLTGAFLCARAAVRQFKRQTPQGGRIINNGSISATTPRPNSAAYTASKHAITGLTKSLALDGRPFDIVCGQIDIGNAGTPLTERMARGVLQPNGQSAPEPVMDVRHAADAVVHMASLPLAANVLFMTVMSSQMPFVGRG